MCHRSRFAFVRCVLCALVLALALALSAPAAQTQYDCGDPTPDEQLVLELINRARANPTAEGQRVGIDINEGLTSAPTTAVVRPPLVMNKNLLQAARAHSKDMNDRNFFAHTNPDGLGPGERAAAAGYTGGVGENIAMGTALTAAGAHDLFIIDPGIADRGHRRNVLSIMNMLYREVGVGFYAGGRGSFVTEDFGLSSTGPFIVGVVYNDANNNNICDPGEGVAGVTITPDSGSNFAVSSTSGGYAIPVGTSGTVTLTATGGTFTAPLTQTVTLTGENVKVDFKTNGGGGGTGGGSGGGGTGGGTSGGSGTYVSGTDLKPTQILVGTDAIVAGMPFIVNVIVSNAGLVPSTECSIALFLNQIGQVSSSAGAAVVGTVPALKSGEVKCIQLTATYPDPGDYTLAVLVDADNSVDESNEQNNMLSLPVSVFARGVDLVITNVTTTEPDPGISATFDVTIQNRGMTRCGAFAVGFYANLSGPPTVGQTPTAIADVAGLAPTATTAVRFTLPTQETRRGGYAWFFADYSNVIAEDIETNNTARATWGVANDPFIIVSDLTASTNTPAVGEQVTFSIVVTDPNNDPISYFWEFGDGTSVSGPGTVAHAFSASGFYTVRVTVSDGPFHVQTSSVMIEVVSEIVDLQRVLGGPVSLSVKKGRFRLMLPRPEGFAHNERLKSVLVEGNPGAKVRYRNSRLFGIATAVGQYLFQVEYQSRVTQKIVRVRYRLTVVP
ncbi:MAG: PKD domain-containing protein [Planctomycetota bacterium]|nr:PKD domain-containing protein [Planctomycetota bacterium]